MTENRQNNLFAMSLGSSIVKVFICLPIITFISPLDQKNNNILKSSYNNL